MALPKPKNSGFGIWIPDPSLLHTQIETNYNTDEQRPFLISRLTFAPPAAASQSDIWEGGEVMGFG